MKILFLILFIFFWNHVDCVGQFILYFGTGATQEFQNVAALAARTVQNFLKLNTDVNIFFEWVLLSSGELAGTSIPYVCQDPMNIFVMLPPSLYVQRYGNSGNCRSYDLSVFYHMTIQLNANPTIGFYMGTDENKLTSNQHDAVSVLMHEIIHGLGFMSLVLDANGNIFNTPYGFLFDWIVFQHATGSGWPSTYGSVPVNNPAVSNVALLIVEPDTPLIFPGNYSVPLYTPRKFKQGVSISHTTIPGLMYYKSVRGESRRILNVYAISVLQRLGYDTQGCATPDWSNECGNCMVGFSCMTSESRRLESFLFK